jgi:hypothetical protein
MPQPALASFGDSFGTPLKVLAHVTFQHQEHEHANIGSRSVPNDR